MNIGKKLKELRLSKGLQTKDLEELLSVEQPTYNKYENGHVIPPPEKLLLLSKFYNISLDELLDNTNFLVEMNPNFSVEENNSTNNLVNDRAIIKAIEDLTSAIKELIISSKKS